MLVSLGVGLIGTVGLFGLKDFLMACESCVQPDGNLGITMLAAGALLVPIGFALRRRATRGYRAAVDSDEAV